MKPITKKELQNMYNVSRTALIRELRLIPDNFYETIKNKKILYPVHLQIIFKHIGSPLNATDL